MPNFAIRNERLNRFAIKMALFYGAVFLTVGVFLPFFPIWLEHRGLSAVEISLLIAMPLISRVVFTPFFAFIADQSGNRRSVLIALSWGSLACALAFIPLSGFWPLLVVAMLFGAFWTSVMPLTESIAMTEVKLQGLDYGRIRLWGSLTFIIASFGGGFLIDIFGPEAILFMMLMSLLLTAIVAYSLPHANKNHSEKTLEKAAPLPPIHWKDALRLARSPLFILFLMASAGIQATHSVYYGFGSLHWQSLGLASGIIGALWAVGVIAEISLFAWSMPLLKRFGPTGLLILGALGALLRWWLTAYDPPLWLLFPLQTLHALSFGAAHLGAIHFIANSVPEEYSATGQGLYAAFAMGVIMGLTTTLSGPLYNAFGGKAYLVMAVLSFASLIGCIVLHKIWDGKSVIGERG